MAVDYTPVVPVIRALGTTALLDGKTDADLLALLDLFGSELDPAKWGSQWSKGLAYMVLHEMEIKSRLETGGDDDSITGTVTRRKEGDLEIQVAAPTSTASQQENYYRSTPYGVAFLRLWEIIGVGGAMVGDYSACVPYY